MRGISVQLLLFLLPYSCNQKEVNFDQYFNQVVQDNLQYRYKGYTYFPLRQGAYNIYTPDGLRVIFTQTKSGKADDIRSIQKKVEGKYQSVEAENSKHIKGLKNRIDNLLQEFRRYHITSIESREQYISLSFETKRFNSETLPVYQNKEKENGKKRQEEVKGVLVFYYINLREADKLAAKLFEYYRPVPLRGNWYYYSN